MDHHLFPWDFLEHVDFSETHGGGLGVEIIDAKLSKLFSCGKSILILSGYVYESVGHYLDNFYSLDGPVCENFPLVEIFFRMELYTIERIIFSLDRSHKLLVLGCSGGGNQIPEILQIQICIKSVQCHCPVVVKVVDTMSFSDFIFLIGVESCE